ncbi:MAG: pyruvate kinase [Desulfocapsaceae bacterium]|nr:pyruvate kinase [Desulfocapsaceae bacterium]
MATEDTADSSSPGINDIQHVLEELLTIRSKMVAEMVRSQRCLDEIHINHQKSARNLLHYLAVRCHDLRPLQQRLAKLGLSSLGRAESHVLVTVDAVLGVLHHLMHRFWQPPAEEADVVDFANGERLLAEHTECLFGPASPRRGVRIMVTMPSEAADNFSLIYDLLQQGMDCMRINCAHDDAAAWLQMIEHLKRAEQLLGRSCRVFMDLAGPKLRTGPLEPGPAVVRIRPCRDIYGKVTAPARVWLTSEDSPQLPLSPAVSLSVPASWLARLHPDERLKLTDARYAKRTFTVVEVMDSGSWVEANKTTYIVPGTVLYHERRVVKGDDRQASVGELPPGKNPIYLTQGDLLILTRDLSPGCPAVRDSGGQLLTPATIGCTIPEVFDDVRPGESIWFDDGMIGGMVEKVERSRVLVRITQTPVNGGKLLADKGINLPESDLHLSATTAKDLKDLSFVAEHADVVELSFANSARDVEFLQQHLARLGVRQPSIVLKIETRRGFDNLPDMLLMAMRAPCCGVMIARGDLAVECGFERLAEVQEEILWICEAAHVPVIWATQVLETLAKEGMASRAEITDAAMGDRAECVMLNKGSYVVHAVRVLDDILRRMQGHQAKKRAMLRELRLAHMLPIKIGTAPREK